MAGKAKSSSSRSHPGWIVFTLLMVVLCAVFILAPVTRIEQFYHRQRAWTAASLGRAADREIAQRGAGWFHDVAVKTQWMPDSLRWAAPRHREGTTPLATTALRMRTMTGKRLIAVWWGIYAACYRFAMIVVWLPYALPIFAAALWDGWQRRKISKWRFEFTSPLRHRYASRGAGYLALIAIAVPALPIPIPPLGVPAALGLLAMAARFWVASIQKRV
jgi:hypothetical protein